MARATFGSLRPHRPLAAWTCALLALSAWAGPGPGLASAPHQEASPAPEGALELFDVERVVDGDTLHVRVDGERVKLRLLSVDTEEKLTGRANISPTKPETVFGEASALWAQEFFDGLAPEGQVPQVGLGFPDGEERYDVYGRLLCHVLLADGSDFNLQLVREGWSPYFNKYGNSRINHVGFVEAQALAQREQLGIWNPGTNRSSDPESPSARRPYAALLPWWDARADAIERFRQRHAENPIRYVDAEDPENLEWAAMACEAGARVEVFGSIFRLFDEDDGSTTLLFRTGVPDSAFRARIPARFKDELAPLHLEARATGEFIQNYLVVAGEVRRDNREGYELLLTNLEQLRIAGPEPEFGKRALAELRELGLEPAGTGR